MSRRLPNLDSVTTIASDGSRVFLHPSDTRGPLTLARQIVAVVLIAVYFGLPFIPINGHPAVFLDVLQGRFHLFGLTFAYQDLWLAFFFISGLGFSLFLITSLFGRIWCGWACPHSVFLEQVYRRLERLFEGPHLHQRKLDEMPWSHPEKLLRRGGKSLVFLLLSAAIAHFFLAYFISLPELYRWMQGPPTQHWPAFLFVFVATGLIYFNFAWFREQLCLVICPYGRLQSALIDDDSLVIGYDDKRGEPRGKARPGAPEKFGDCINCFRCVQVCPTGIDIRQGLQIECIACGNCIDACDQVMTELGRPKGLVRYDSLRGLRDNKRRVLRPRIFLYAFLMLLGVGAMLFSFTLLRPINMQVTRMRGMPYFLSDAGLRNQFQIRLINKQPDPVTFNLTLDTQGLPVQATGAIGDLTLPPGSDEVHTLVVNIAKSDWTGPFHAAVRVAGTGSGGQPFTITRKFEFLGPDPKFLQSAPTP